MLENIPSQSTMIELLGLFCQAVKFRRCHAQRNTKIPAPPHGYKSRCRYAGHE